MVAVPILQSRWPAAGAQGPGHDQDDPTLKIIQNPSLKLITVTNIHTYIHSDPYIHTNIHAHIYIH